MHRAHVLRRLVAEHHKAGRITHQKTLAGGSTSQLTSALQQVASLAERLRLTFRSTAGTLSPFEPFTKPPQLSLQVGAALYPLIHPVP